LINESALIVRRTGFDVESISLSVKRVERNDKIVAYYGTCFIFSNHGDIAFEDHCLIFIAFEDNYLISKKEQLIEVLSKFYSIFARYKNGSKVIHPSFFLSKQHFDD